MLAERVGVVNLGVEGLMAMGALTAIAATTSFPRRFSASSPHLLVGAVFGMLFAVATVLCVPTRCSVAWR